MGFGTASQIKNNKSLHSHTIPDNYDAHAASMKVHK